MDALLGEAIDLLAGPAGSSAYVLALVFLLAFVGGHMLWEARSEAHEEKRANDPTRGLSLIMLSVATSIDALDIDRSTPAM